MHFPRLEATLLRLQPIILRSTTTTTTPALKLSGYTCVYIYISLPGNALKLSSITLLISSKALCLTLMLVIVYLFRGIYIQD